MRVNGVTGLVGSPGPSGQSRATELICMACNSLFISTGKKYDLQVNVVVRTFSIIMAVNIFRF